MKRFETLEFEQQNDLGILWFNRPDIHNAFNERMISEIIEAIEWVNGMDEIRVLILRGRGKSFCAGADLNWMRAVSTYTYEQNYAESYQLSKCFYAIYTCAKPTIAMVHGAAIGGANGLLSACDMAFCEENTTFSLSEVKIGIVPACISPYVIKRVGECNARELMLTGRRFQGAEAAKYGLVNASFSLEEMEAHVDRIIGQLRTSGPMAITRCKNLINEVCNTLDLGEALGYTARMIADIRSSEEGQEGMAAFLEKRKPNWVK